MMEILLEEERLQLLAEHAVWWPAKKTLLLSDLHWGKSAHFRKNGIPMPGGTQDKDAQCLAKLVRDYSAERLIIAGDFFHSRHNKEVDNFGLWRAAHSALHIDFVLGNHDILPRQAYDSWELMVHEHSLLVAPFFISHDAVQNPEHFTIHGHVHPGVRLQGLGKQAFTLPAFCLNETCMVMPAFGEFTGCKIVRGQDYRKIYVVGDGKVMLWK